MKNNSYPSWTWTDCYIPRFVYRTMDRWIYSWYKLISTKIKKLRIFRSFFCELFLKTIGIVFCWFRVAIYFSSQSISDKYTCSNRGNSKHITFCNPDDNICLERDNHIFNDEYGSKEYSNKDQYCIKVHNFYMWKDNISSL